MTYKVRLDPYYSKLKRKKGWVPCNDPHLLVCALWEHNDTFKKTNILKISIPKSIPGYDFEEILYKMKYHNEAFVLPDVIARD